MKLNKLLALLLITPVITILTACGNKTNEEVMLGIYENRGYEAASEYIDSLDPTERIDLIYTLGAKELNITTDEFKEMLNEPEEQEDDNICDKVEVVDNWISGDWASGREMTIVLRNNTGKTLDYVKVDIFYYDKDGNLKNTEWTNKSGTFLDGGEFRLETYVDTPLSVTQYKVDVSEAKVK